LWFNDIGYAIENHGVEPDIEVEMGPDEEKDLQLERALKEIKELMRN